MARREFNLQDKPILAYLFIAAQGEKANSYRAMLNGKRVGDDVSIPDPLEYFTMRYRGYDVVENLNYTPSLTDFCTNFIHLDVKKELDFSCSNPDLNYQFSCFKRSFLSNLVNIPTDCPGRKRRGWTGDSFAVIEAQSIYFNVLKFYERWFEDMMDSRECPIGCL